MRVQTTRMAKAMPRPHARSQRSVGEKGTSTWARARARPQALSPQQTEDAAPAAEKVVQSTLPLPAFCFLIALQIPWIFEIGGLRLAPYRAVLLVMLPICLIQWMSGKAGKIRVTDIALFLFCGWCALAMTVVHGFGAAVQPAGIMFIETIGGYLLARCTIRSDQDFFQLAKLLFLIVLVLFPFAVFETLTGRNIILQIFGMVMQTYPDAEHPLRWGLDRVQGNNIHPIHFGIEIASALTLTHLVLGYGKPFFARYQKSAIVFITAFLSLSSGPLTSMIGQIGLLSWSRIMRGFPQKWTILMMGGLGIFVLAQLFANRSIAVILIGYFAFDEASAYIRTLTWQFGTQSILANPLWGVGFGDWERPEWLTPSIDMYWIIDSVRHGMPAGFFVFLAFFSAVISIGRLQISDERLATYRLAYVITMGGFFMTGWAVYLWETSYALYAFMLGSGFWLLDMKTTASSGTEIVPGKSRPKARNRARPPARPVVPSEPHPRSATDWA